MTQERHLNSFATMAGPVEEWLMPYIRELLSYTLLCPVTCILDRGVPGQFTLRWEPTPMYWSRQVELPWALRMSELESSHVVLDAGSGLSSLKFALAKRSRAVHCLDHDPGAFQATFEVAGILGVQGKVSSVLGDVRDLPFRDGFFDRVFCVSVLEHLKEGWMDAVRELKRVTRSGGAVMLTFDMVVEGSTEGDEFRLGQKELWEVVGEFGIDKLECPPSQLLNTMDAGQKLSVVMIRWVKP